MRSLETPQGADWAIIDGPKKKKKTIFLTLVNHANDPLGGRSSIPNWFIREEVDDWNKWEGRAHSDSPLPPTFSISIQHFFPYKRMLCASNECLLIFLS